MAERTASCEARYHRRRWEATRQGTSLEGPAWGVCQETRVGCRCVGPGFQRADVRRAGSPCMPRSHVPPPTRRAGPRWAYACACGAGVGRGTWCGETRTVVDRTHPLAAMPANLTGWSVGCERRAHVCLPGLCFSSSLPGLCFSSSLPGSLASATPTTSLSRSACRAGCLSQPNPADVRPTTARGTSCQVKTRHVTHGDPAEATPPGQSQPSRVHPVKQRAGAMRTRTGTQPLGRSSASPVARISKQLPEAPGGGRHPESGRQAPVIPVFLDGNHPSGEPPPPTHSATSSSCPPGRRRTGSPASEAGRPRRLLAHALASTFRRMLRCVLGKGYCKAGALDGAACAEPLSCRWCSSSHSVSRVRGADRGRCCLVRNASRPSRTTWSAVWWTARGRPSR